MTPLEAARKVQAEFPIANYVKDSRVEGPLVWVGSKVASLLERGASVLDFGSGPGDIAAVLARLGYEAHAADDLLDPWHQVPGNREKILGFCAESGVRFEALEDGRPWPWRPGQFDMVMIHHVLEHVHNSPRPLMQSLAELIRPRGYLFVTVPSAVNLRKRLAVLRGRTNLPSFGRLYWSEGQWRGHVREYVRSDLEQLAQFLDFEVVALETYHALLNAIPARWWGPWRAVTGLFPGWRDSWSLVARKPEPWNPWRELPPGDRRYDRWRMPAYG